MSVDWSTYSKYYDGIARNNPAYKELVQTFEATVRALSLPDDAHIADVGCGTGNFTMAFARAYPRAVLSAFDNNERMLAVVRAKAAMAGIELDARIADLRTRPKPPASLDAISYVHCLYVLNKDGALEAMAQARIMLKPGGYLVVADIGRELDTTAFARAGLRHMLDQYGPLEFLREGFLMRGVQKEAKRIRQCQREGRFYMHTLAELTAEIEKLGFEIVSARDDMYRGITDLVVARKPPE